MSWEETLDFLQMRLGKRPKDLQAVLLLIGVQELGRGIGVFSKEEKQDLIHIGVCRLLAMRGYYMFVGVDEEGWPHYELKEALPEMNSSFQEDLLKSLSGEYFLKEENEDYHI